jgi:hypothetical protein
VHCPTLGGKKWVPLQEVSRWPGFAFEDLEKELTQRGCNGRGKQGYFYSIGLLPCGRSYATVAEAEERDCLTVHSLGITGARPHSLVEIDGQAARRQKDHLVSFKKTFMEWHAADEQKSIVLWYGPDCIGGHQKWEWPAATPKHGRPAPPPPRAASRTVPDVEKISDAESNSSARVDARAAKALRQMETAAKAEARRVS